MTERLSCGHPRLDGLLGGGLPRDSISLIVGPPGTGKTILTQQYTFHNATVERPALYLATVSEPFDKILRYGQSLAFFESGAVGKRVIYEDLGKVLMRGGLSDVMSVIGDLMRKHRPALVIIDSFKALRPFAVDEREFRRFLHDLAGQLTALSASAFWVGEYEPGSDEAAEFAVADNIISLSTKRSAEREARMLRVLKLRGSSYASGEHAYRITPGGLAVFPRLADSIDASLYPIDKDRVSTGVPALDDALGNGYWPGSSTLVCGPSGIGKTLMGLHFVFCGAALGESGIIATLQENPTQLARVVAGFGWSIDRPGVHLMSRTPVDMYIDEWVYELIELTEKVGAKRVLVDSLLDLELASRDPRRFREWVYSLTNRFSRAGISLLMTLEVPELFEPSRISREAVSHLADNVLLLRYLRTGDTLQRALTVLKTRASRHDPSVMRFEILKDGIVLRKAAAELVSSLPGSESAEEEEAIRPE